MLVLTTFEAYRTKKSHPLVLTLGTFDGVHLGHQHVLRKVCQRAKRIGGVSAILTFSEHPKHILKHKEPPYLITSTPHRLRLLDQLGFDIAFLIKFNKKFSKFSPYNFAKKIIVNKLHVSEIVLGYDSRFGRNRKGTVQDMSRFAREFKFRNFTVRPKLLNNQPISSTKIRSFIRRGDFSNVKKCLGRPYSILGDVVKGIGLGRKIGFPTANLNPHSEALPPCGVYLVSLNIVDMGLKKTKVINQYNLNDQVYKKGLLGLLNIGVRPTINKAREGKSVSPIISEIHILNFNGDLYGKTLEVTFVKRLRDEIHFESIDALKKQIKKDIDSVDKYTYLARKSYPV